MSCNFVVNTGFGLSLFFEVSATLRSPNFDGAVGVIFGLATKKKLGVFYLNHENHGNHDVIQ